MPARKPVLANYELCQWFALCVRFATTVRRGPIGDGKFGPIPICDRCNERVENLK